MYEVLMERESSTELVALRWDTNHNSLNILLVDKAVGVSYQNDVPNALGMEAFNHPFLYAVVTEPMQTLNPVIKEYV